MNNQPVQWTPTDRIEQSKDHIVSDMDGEKVMLSVQKGKYYNLGEVGGRIWDLLASPCTVQQLIDNLLAQYEVEPETCRAHVASFLDTLWSEGLICRASAS
ncbi:lasso peptide biosynthesis PqqD family chaperone [Cohnella ginsengisoli]|uniref:Lasso peptide biosynthesis PqqD family chaperone n=1 Tax=Cohnella ginsengisoli TaxID=425004 RepID=A0A9X4KGJ4_9BACL|nr:lasso peptide biosynthesis PqqD family chaperone [Cohnella ginsengisoli]MDG0791772.1 lasso peptide biosynthesis PqqD family chaperone [Cohnella ginsengisoli]